MSNLDNRLTARGHAVLDELKHAMIDQYMVKYCTTNDAPNSYEYECNRNGSVRVWFTDPKDNEVLVERTLEPSLDVIVIEELEAAVVL